jgi:uncharacterized lipoprotein YmbA
MKSNHASQVVVVAVAAAGLLAACSLNPKEDPTRYYVLATLTEDPGLYDAAGLAGETDEEASLSAGPHVQMSVGVGPITLPGYLKRSRMVTRESDNELKYFETSRWAQPLGESLQYSMLVNIGMLLWTDQIVLHPWYKTRQPAYAVEVDIGRFERGHDGSALLAARWTIRNADGEVLAANSFKQVVAADSASIATTVNAQSQLVAAMSRQIADALRRVAS